MEWVNKILTIKNILNKSGFDDLSDKITNAQLVLGTSGEMFLNVIQVLNEIKEENYEAFSLIKKEYDSLIQFAKDIGFYS